MFDGVISLKLQSSHSLGLLGFSGVTLSRSAHRIFSAIPETRAIVYGLIKVESIIKTLVWGDLDAGGKTVKQ